MRFIMMIMLCMASVVSATENRDDYQLFTTILTEWTRAFNHKDREASCGLFSKNVIADYQGVPQKTYATICDGFKKIFIQNDQQYRYQFKLRHVYRKDDLAVVRVTWFLSTSKDGKLVSTVRDEGMDVFVRREDGRWEIVNYLAFPVI